MDTEKKNKIYVVITKLVIVLSILFEIFAFLQASKVGIFSGEFITFQLHEFLVLNILPIAIIGLMWIFGIFRLKD